VEFLVDKVALGQVFSEVLRFPLPIFIPLISPQSPSSIIWGWYNTPVVAAVPSELSLTPLTTIKKTLNYVMGRKLSYNFVRRTEKTFGKH
jgi:hypothetical protein